MGTCFYTFAGFIKDFLKRFIINPTTYYRGIDMNYFIASELQNILGSRQTEHILLSHASATDQLWGWQQRRFLQWWRPPASGSRVLTHPSCSGSTPWMPKGTQRLITPKIMTLPAKHGCHSADSTFIYHYVLQKVSIIWVCEGFTLTVDTCMCTVQYHVLSQWWQVVDLP